MKKIIFYLLLILLVTGHAQVFGQRHDQLEDKILNHKVMLLNTGLTSLGTAMLLAWPTSQNRPLLVNHLFYGWLGHVFGTSLKDSHMLESRTFGPGAKLLFLTGPLLTLDDFVQHSVQQLNDSNWTSPVHNFYTWMMDPRRQSPVMVVLRAFSFNQKLHLSYGFYQGLGLGLAYVWREHKYVNLESLYFLTLKYNRTATSIAYDFSTFGLNYMLKLPLNLSIGTGPGIRFRSKFARVVWILKIGFN